MFALKSLDGEYAYHNIESGVGSFGIMYFDGMGSITMEDLRLNTHGPDIMLGAPRTITSLGAGAGSYDIGPAGNGTAILDFVDNHLRYEILVKKIGDDYSIALEDKPSKVKQAVEVQAYLMTGGLDGQLVACDKATYRMSLMATKSPDSNVYS